MSSSQGNASMKPTSTQSPTSISAKNGTAGTIENRAPRYMPPAFQQATPGGQRRLTQLASHIAEMKRDGFTLVNRSTYAVVAARSAPTPTPKKVAETCNIAATIKGALTAMIGNKTISTTVTVPSTGEAKRQGLVKALSQLELHKALYKAFGVKRTPTTPAPIVIRKVLQSTDQIFLFALLWTTQYTACSTAPSAYKYSTRTCTSCPAHIVLTACPTCLQPVPYQLPPLIRCHRLLQTPPRLCPATAASGKPALPTSATFP